MPTPPKRLSAGADGRSRRTPASRRSVLALAGGAAIGTLAGCLGGSDDGPPYDTGGDTVDSLPTPVRGTPDADVTVAVFEDFSCPGCRDFTLDLAPVLLEEYGDTGRIRYEHWDYPLPLDDWSWHAANAARAVQDEAGDEAFFSYAHALYENQDDYSMELLGDLAEDDGVAASLVRTAAEEGTYHPVVQADRDVGDDRGVQATPSVFVDDEPIDLEGNAYQAITDAIEAAES